MDFHNAHVVEYLQGARGWYDGTLEADHWNSLDDVTPTHAAMLLCRFNPNADSFDEARQITSDELKPEHLVRLEQRLVDIGKASPKPRTLRDWHQTARQIGLVYHSWIDGYMEATAKPGEGIALPRTKAAHVLDVGASGETAGPQPLTTGDIAFCFAGLRWKTEEEWKAALGKGRCWIEACVAVPAGGRGRGVAPKLWNPVLLAAALVHDGYVKARSARAAFQTRTPLMPWLDAWKTYEADNFDTD